MSLFFMTLWPILKALMKLDLKRLTTATGVEWDQTLSGALADVTDAMIGSSGKDKSLKAALDAMIREQKALREFFREQNEPELPDDLSERAQAIAEAYYLKNIAG